MPKKVQADAPHKPASFKYVGFYVNKKVGLDSAINYHLSRIADQTESVMKHKLECWCCGTKTSGQDISEAQFAFDTYAKGWRFINSGLLQGMGVACPSCVARPGKERAAR